MGLILPFQIFWFQVYLIVASFTDHDVPLFFQRMHLNIHDFFINLDIALKWGLFFDIDDVRCNT